MAQAPQVVGGRESGAIVAERPRGAAAGRAAWMSATLQWSPARAARRSLSSLIRWTSRDRSALALPRLEQPRIGRVVEALVQRGRRRATPVNVIAGGTPPLDRTRGLR
jgi:hypothetical protein